MIIHYVKDLLEKLKKIDEKLEVSLEKDEIQTLGLKLRFHTNEVKHYKKLLDDIINKIEEIQKKYGFISESVINKIEEKESPPINKSKEVSENSSHDINPLLIIKNHTGSAENLVSEGKIDEAFYKLEEIISNFKKLNISINEKQDDNFLSEYLFKENKTKTEKFCAAYLLTKLNYTGKAINLFEELLLDNFSNYQIYLLLGDCCFKRGIFKKALFYYKKSFELNRLELNSILGICKSLIEVGNNEEVVTFTDNLDVKDERISLIRIFSLVNSKKLDIAEKEAMELINSSSNESLKSSAYKLMGKIREMQNDFLSAIDYYENIILMNPYDDEIRYKIGEIYLNNKAIMLAKNHLIFLIKNSPESEFSDKARSILFENNVTI